MVIFGQASLTANDDASDKYQKLVYDDASDKHH